MYHSGPKLIWISEGSTGYVGLQTTSPTPPQRLHTTRRHPFFNFQKLPLPSWAFREWGARRRLHMHLDLAAGRGECLVSSASPEGSPSCVEREPEMNQDINMMSHTLISLRRIRSLLLQASNTTALSPSASRASLSWPPAPMWGGAGGKQGQGGVCCCCLEFTGVIPPTHHEEQYSVLF